MAEWIPPGGALSKRPGLANRLSREPGLRFRSPGERTKDSKPRRATGSGKVSRRLGVPRSSRISGPEAEQDEKNSHTVAKRQGLSPVISLVRASSGSRERLTRSQRGQRSFLVP
jgi:hypothetical protein